MLPLESQRDPIASASSPAADVRAAARTTRAEQAYLIGVVCAVCFDRWTRRAINVASMSRPYHVHVTSILLIWERQHGSTDGVISIAEEDGLIAGYKATGVLYEQHELMGWGHGADAANVNDQSTGFKNVTQHDVQVRATTSRLMCR